MEELYPNKDHAGQGFYVQGSAITEPQISLHRPSPGRIIAGIRSFGKSNFFVHQADQTSAPSFDFWPLTAQFLASVIGDEDPDFSFSIISKRLGDVTHVSGVEARETGDISQSMTSLRGDGSWSKEGLHFNLSGELGDNACFPNRLTPVKYRSRQFEIKAVIPWTVLRFMLYEVKHIVIAQHRRIFQL